MPKSVAPSSAPLYRDRGAVIKLERKRDLYTAEKAKIVGAMHVDDLDAHALKASADLMSDPEELVNFLSMPCTNQFMIFRVLHRWVCEHVADTPAYYTKPKGKKMALVTDPLGVMNAGVSNSKGFCRLLQFLCKYAQIKSEVVAGYAKGNGWTRHVDIKLDAQNAPVVDQEIPGQHWWIMANLEDKPYLADPAWAAGRVNDKGKWVKDFNDGLFLKEPDGFWYSHCPCTDKFQLIRPPRSYHAWKDTPFVEYSKESLGIINMSNEEGTFDLVKNAGTLTVQFTKKFRISVLMEGVQNHHIWQLDKDGVLTVHLRMPNKSEDINVLRIMGTTLADNYTFPVLTYQLNTHSNIGSHPQYPTGYTRYGSLDDSEEFDVEVPDNCYYKVDHGTHTIDILMRSHQDEIFKDLWGEFCAWDERSETLKNYPQNYVFERKGVKKIRCHMYMPTTQEFRLTFGIKRGGKTYHFGSYLVKSKVGNPTTFPKGVNKLGVRDTHADSRFEADVTTLKADHDGKFAVGIICESKSYEVTIGVRNHGGEEIGDSYSFVHFSERKIIFHPPTKGMYVLDLKKKNQNQSQATYLLDAAKACPDFAKLPKCNETMYGMLDVATELGLSNMNSMLIHAEGTYSIPILLPKSGDINALYNSLSYKLMHARGDRTEALDKYTVLERTSFGKFRLMFNLPYVGRYSLHLYYKTRDPVVKHHCMGFIIDNTKKNDIPLTTKKQVRCGARGNSKIVLDGNTSTLYDTGGVISARFLLPLSHSCNDIQYIFRGAKFSERELAMHATYNCIGHDRLEIVFFAPEEGNYILEVYERERPRNSFPCCGKYLLHFSQVCVPTPTFAKKYSGYREFMLVEPNRFSLTANQPYDFHFISPGVKTMTIFMNDNGPKKIPHKTIWTTNDHDFVAKGYNVGDPGILKVQVNFANSEKQVIYTYQVLNPGQKPTDTTRQKRVAKAKGTSAEDDEEVIESEDELPGTMDVDMDEMPN